MLFRNVKVIALSLPWSGKQRPLDKHVVVNYYGGITRDVKQIKISEYLYEQSWTNSADMAFGSNANVTNCAPLGDLIIRSCVEKERTI